MVPPFPEEKAASVLKSIFEKICSGRIAVETFGKPSEERKNQGFMLGVLVCLDSEDNELNLVAISGIAKTLVFPASFSQKDAVLVPPIVSPKKIEDALSKNDFEIHDLTKKIASASGEEKRLLSEKRKNLCSESLQRVFDLYSFHCADKKIRSLKEILTERGLKTLPPTGTGDCSAPKLLDYAFKNGLIPVSMAETKVEFPDFKNSSLRLESPCDARCGIILPSMLGLHILYRDEEIIVVNKQSGVLSVPGRGPEKQDCVVNRVKRLFPQCLAQPSVHRLDMETSGVMVLAFTKESHKNLSRQFETGGVKKEYIALLDGILPERGVEKTGVMELYFRLDVENRPHQIWDRENGKKSVTEWELLDVEKYRSPSGGIRPVTRVLFKPRTGRTHQLRLASSDPHGFGVPIVGDTLYGSCESGERLMLHARIIEFIHPKTGETMIFEHEPDW